MGRYCERLVDFGNCDFGTVGPVGVGDRGVAAAAVVSEAIEDVAIVLLQFDGIGDSLGDLFGLFGDRAEPVVAIGCFGGFGRVVGEVGVVELGVVAAVGGLRVVATLSAPDLEFNAVSLLRDRDGIWGLVFNPSGISDGLVGKITSHRALHSFLNFFRYIKYAHP